MYKLRKGFTCQPQQKKQQLWKICTSRSFAHPVFAHLYTAYPNISIHMHMWKSAVALEATTSRENGHRARGLSITRSCQYTGGVYKLVIHMPLQLLSVKYYNNPSTVLNSLFSTTAHPTHHQWLPVSSRADQGGNDQLLASLIARLQSTLLRNAASASSANILDSSSSPSSVASFLPAGCFLQPLGSSNRWNLPLFTMAFLSTPEDLQRLSLQLNQHFTMKNFTTFPLERCKNNKLSV
ncbi:Siroheme decarboxylase beta subunit [Trichinella pseudospiralis]